MDKKDEKSAAKQEESKADASANDPMLKIEEDYESKDFGAVAQDKELDLYLGVKWTIWEFVDYQGSKKAWANDNYDKLCRKVAWFDNIITFHQVWNRLPHANVSKILCDGNEFKVFHDFEGQPYQVTTLMMFKHGIKPAFEDKRNKAELRLDLGNIKDLDTLQLIWETLVHDMISGNCKGVTTNETEGISGIRLVQKAKNNSINGYRLEIWLLSDQSENAITKLITSYLEDYIINDICSNRLKDSNVQFKPFGH